jgi:hypothetical protein
MTKSPLCVVAVAVTAGCATPGSRETPFQAPSTIADSATLVVMEKGGPLNATFIVAMDSSHSFIGGLARNGWFEARVPPGHHEFYAIPMYLDLPKGGVCEGFSADLTPGHAYYVQLRFVMKSAQCDPERAGVHEGQCEVAEGNAEIVNDYDYDPEQAKGLKAGESRWNVNVLDNREKVRKDPVKYLQAYQRLEPVADEGKAQLAERLGSYRCRAFVTPVTVGTEDFMK